MEFALNTFPAVGRSLIEGVRSDRARGVVRKWTLDALHPDLFLLAGSLLSRFHP